MKKYRLICATSQGVQFFYIVAMTKREAAQKLRRSRADKLTILSIQ